jgi:photosystem II stability/assembly factor-like uncharacterized protein
MSDQLQQLNQDFVYALAAPAGTLPGKVWYAARQSGLYLSGDEGSTWQSAYASLNLDSNLPTTCLALTQEEAHKAYLFAGVPGHVMRSEDGCKSWMAIPLPYDSSIPTALAISSGFAKDGILLLGTNEDGVLRSADLGRSWATWNFGLVDFNVLCLAMSPTFDRDETVFAGTGSGLFISQTGGKAWKELKLPAGYLAVLSLAISPNFESDGTLLVGTESGGLWMTQDGGLSWQRLGEKEINGMVNQVILHPQYPARKGIFVLHENAVLRSEDHGKTWSVLLEDELASLAAFQDETTELSLLVGLVDGSVKKV